MSVDTVLTRLAVMADTDVRDEIVATTKTALRALVLVTLAALLGPAAGWAAQGDVDLVSRATGATGAKGNGNSGSLSADGRYVTFESRSPSLDPEDPNTDGDVFVRDLQTNTTTLVSRATGATGATSNGASYGSAISA